MINIQFKDHIDLKQKSKKCLKGSFVFFGGFAVYFGGGGENPFYGEGNLLFERYNKSLL